MKKIAVFLLFISYINATNAQDALFSWAKKMGVVGNNETPYAIKTDGSGNVYTCGQFNGSVDFDPGVGVYNLVSSNSSYDAFIQKLDANGNFVWAKSFGKYGFLNVKAQGIEVDATGNVYTTGSFYGDADFDPSPVDYILSSSGNAFVSKLDANGNFVWAKKIGDDDPVNTGNCTVYGNAIKLDAAGNIYLTGQFSGYADFDPSSTATAYLLNNNGFDIFVEKLNNAGAITWVKQMGNPTEDDAATAITVDAFGNVLTTGTFTFVADFDPSAATFNLTATAHTDIFISKLSSTGSFVWAKQLGGPIGEDISSGIAVDASNNIFTSGSFRFDADFDPGISTYTLSSVGGYDAFVSKLNADGSFNWAKQIGNSLDDNANTISVANNNVYYTGTFLLNVDFDPGSGVSSLTSAGGPDIFISKLNNDGSFGWAKRIGIDYGEKPFASYSDANESVYTTGLFFQTCDFDPGSGISNLTSAGGSDIFIQKMTKDIVTPVILISFSVVTPNCGEAALNWTAANEQGNKGFEIEQSNNGLLFNKIGYQEGNGNTPQATTYHYLAHTTTMGTQYFRLKQLDFDGHFSYSNIVSVKNNCYKTILQVWPNPVANMLKISGLNTFNLLPIHIYDSAGRSVFAGVYNNGLSIAKLPSGKYWAQIGDYSALGFIKK